MFILVIGCVAFLTANGTEEKSGSITLMQNKPEIDAQLKAYAAVWSEKTGIATTMKSIGGSSSVTLGQQLRTDFAAGDMPDIFVIAGPEDYKDWESIILDLSNEAWVKETSVAYKADGKVVGFPVAIEGWGMAYNADVLAAAGVDPKGLTNLGAYREAFATIEAKKAELGLDSVVSMAASSGMNWVTSDHNFNSLLSDGLPYGDQSVANEFVNGQVDAVRLSEYADWVELLFMYADKAILTTGDYDAQVGAFAAGKAAFLHQGNWTDGNIKQAGATFEMAFAPHGSMNAVTDGIFVSAPAYYVINKESENVEAAKQFLNDMVFTVEGNKFMVEEAGMIPAYANVKLNPTGQLSKSVQKWAAEGKIYSWNQYLFSTDFRHQTLGPIYEQFALGLIDKDEFISFMTEAIKNRK